MNKKILILSLGLLTASIMTGCSQSSTDRIMMSYVDYICKYDNFELIEDDERGDIAEIRDKNTGVHYYFYTIKGAMSPVYESNGTVRVSK